MRVLAVLDRVAEQDEAIVEVEQVLVVDLHVLVLLAVEPDLDGHVGTVLAAGLEIVGHGLDAQGGVAGAVPVGGVPAIVEQILHQPRGLGILGIGRGQQLEIVGVGLGLAAVPVPPVVVGGQTQVGGLVLLILNDVLLDVLEDHVELVRCCCFLEQGQAEHRLGVDRDVSAVAEEELAHLGVLDAAVDQDHVDQGVDVVGMFLPGNGLGRGVVETHDLLGLVVLEPAEASFEHVAAADATPFCLAICRPCTTVAVVCG